MCCKGFLKRILPFFLTFSIGLLIASFFITVAAPNFNFKKRGFNKHRQYHQRVESENQRLREENNRLKKELAEIEKQNLAVEFDVPPPIPVSPAKVKTVVVREVTIKNVKGQ